MVKLVPRPSKIEKLKNERKMYIHMTELQVFIYFRLCYFLFDKIISLVMLLPYFVNISNLFFRIYFLSAIISDLKRERNEEK